MESQKDSFYLFFYESLKSVFRRVPVCHGSGDMMGHYTFGARTGGSVVIYGFLYLIISLFFSRGFDNIVQIFPLPALGVILIYEGFALTSHDSRIFVPILRCC
ncbi:MAG: putative sulfate/molybdate transporter [Candidatus Dadabacteria bacterium]|nr:putative sulfate/molybdate transporter [Candidatus Dadabacteria bacterium]